MKKRKAISLFVLGTITSSGLAVGGYFVYTKVFASQNNDVPSDSIELTQMKEVIKQLQNNPNKIITLKSDTASKKIVDLKQNILEKVKKKINLQYFKTFDLKIEVNNENAKISVLPQPINLFVAPKTTSTLRSNKILNYKVKRAQTNNEAKVHLELDAIKQLLKGSLLKNQKIILDSSFQDKDFKEKFKEIELKVKERLETKVPEKKLNHIIVSMVNKFQKIKDEFRSIDFFAFAKIENIHFSVQLPPFLIKRELTDAEKLQKNVIKEIIDLLSNSKNKVITLPSTTLNQSINSLSSLIKQEIEKKHTSLNWDKVSLTFNGTKVISVIKQKLNFFLSNKLNGLTQEIQIPNFFIKREKTNKEKIQTLKMKFEQELNKNIYLAGENFKDKKLDDLKNPILAQLKKQISFDSNYDINIENKAEQITETLQTLNFELVLGAQKEPISGFKIKRIKGNDEKDREAIELIGTVDLKQIDNIFNPKQTNPSQVKEIKFLLNDDKKDKFKDITIKLVKNSLKTDDEEGSVLYIVLLEKGTQTKQLKVSYNDLPKKHLGFLDSNSYKYGGFRSIQDSWQKQQYYINKFVDENDGDISKLLIHYAKLENIDISKVTKWPDKIKSARIVFTNVISSLNDKPADWSDEVWKLIQDNKQKS